MAAGLVTAKDAAIDASFVTADASWQRKMRKDDLAPDAGSLPRPVREWLADEASVVPVDAGRRRAPPTELSRTDPTAAWSARTARGRLGCALNVLIDAPSGVVLDVEASPARFAAEVDAGRDMLGRAFDQFGYRPKRVAADGAYGSATEQAVEMYKLAKPTARTMREIKTFDDHGRGRKMVRGLD